MLSDLFFVFKMFVLAVLVTVAMQVKIGNNNTVEENFHRWIKQSTLVDYVQSAVDGGMSLTKASYSKTHGLISSVLNKVGHRHKSDDRGTKVLGLKLKRFYESDDEDLTEDTTSKIPTHLPSAQSLSKSLPPND